MEFLVHHVLEALVEAEDTYDVGSFLQVHVGAPVQCLPSYLPEGHFRTGHEPGNELFLLEVGLDAYLDGLVNLLPEGLPVAFTCPIGGLGQVYRHVLKAAETHGLRVLNHVVVLYRSPQTAASREGYLVPVKDEVGYPVLAGYLTGVFEYLVLFWLLEGVLVDMQVALGEGEGVAVAVPLAPDVQHGHGKASGRFGVFSVGLSRILSS